MVEGKKFAEQLQRKQREDAKLVGCIADESKNAVIKPQHLLVLEVCNKKLVGSIGDKDSQQKMADPAQQSIVFRIQGVAR